ncbi:dual 3',5'-cyclic-AMP and -GMP phosphodiesterase 11A-like isoform X2 [Xenia sp. Carnegie-2017]|uniref:dual 3',5'-cyclic-AMP and -GMP phosphodiesterase 11A-like isoform X2 n=1 Tax=Xenia sp. Carnegie-2017 TaxID=2897299 RepID=UPI001F03B450|nr:dual 3',5'-cyclic-AMP and -GMP phosphodiesterase 11A-like isoform X2 [Xenia sp. Carnegie-2017]
MVVGVAQLINKNPDASTFTKEDQELCNRYLPFCGIAITNAQLFELSQKEFQRNKFLIEMIHDIFEEQTSIGKVVNRIMKRSLKLMKCEHCSVLLLNEPLLDSGDDQLIDRNCENLKFSNSYHLKMASTGRHSVIASEINGELFKALTVLSERVVANPKTLCISDINEDADLKILAGRSCDEIKSILSMPIRNSKSEILGVASLMNKVNNCPFDENDMSFFEAIVLFCGLGINNTMLYDQMAKAKAKQQVALEVLSYHVKCPQVEVERLKLSAIPSVASIDLGSLQFDDFSLDPDQMLTASVRMFLDCGLIEDFNIDYQTLCLWLTTTRKNYRNVIYHNWRHAFNVAQSMFAILTTGNMMQHLSKLECFALLAGCLCHDVDHRGTNNAFQEKTASPLATLYGTSVMEHHHFNHTIMILNTEGHNIFQNLSPSSYRKVISLLRHSILSTDLAINMKYRGTFFPLVENGELDLEDDNHRSMLRAMLMTTCDLCGITKPWKIQREVVNLVASEFIQQGDIEREKFHENNIPAMMDRQKKNELPRMQVQFFDNVGIPLFRICEKVNPLLKPLLDGAIANRNQWEQLQSSSLSAET